MVDLWDDDDDEPVDGGLEQPSLGACCACETTGPGVRNVLMLHHRSPMAGRGWGCLECGASSDGAIAVVCDDCLDSQRQLRFACRGWPGSDGRVPMESLIGWHDHDHTRHRESGD